MLVAELNDRWRKLPIVKGLGINLFTILESWMNRVADACNQKS